MGMSDKIEAFINDFSKTIRTNGWSLNETNLLQYSDVFRHKLITLFQQGLIPTTVTSSNQDEAAEVI